MALMMAACTERNASPEPIDPAAIIRARLDSIIDVRHTEDSIRMSQVPTSTCWCCDDMVAKKDEEVLPDSCYFRFDVNEQKIFVSSDTTALVDDPGMNIMCINDAIVINGKRCYTFKNVMFFEELLALKKWNNYYVYGFTSTTDDHGPYVHQSPNGVLIRADFQKKITVTEDVKYLEPGNICTFLDSLERK